MHKVTGFIITLSILAACIYVASVSVDRMTERDCARGIKGACEEVERLQLKNEGASKLNLK